MYYYSLQINWVSLTKKKSVEFLVQCCSNQSVYKWRVETLNSNARGYNWTSLFLGEINTATWPYRLGESQK
jgi:hypothetical protein